MGTENFFSVAAPLRQTSSLPQSPSLLQSPSLPQSNAKGTPLPICPPKKHPHLRKFLSLSGFGILLLLVVAANPFTIPLQAQQPRGGKGNSGATTPPRGTPTKPPAKPTPRPPKEPSQGSGSKGNEKVLAIYADAANFQNNGELELAIEQWKKLLSTYPTDPLAPKAAHYLGVCYMQLKTPNYEAARVALETALKVPKYELREESLVNLAWCAYSLGIGAEPRNTERLRQALDVYATLLKESRSSRYADRALFYSGECHYNLGAAREAITAYDQLLESKAGEKSPLRCDALYAKGVAQEDLELYTDAIQTYRTMLSSCGEHALAPAVRFQLAEVLVLVKDYAEAERLFAQVVSAGGEDKPRAMVRQAFVLTQLDRAAEGAKLYEAVIQEYPTSPYASAALMAAAQSFYRAGDFAQAEARFTEVIRGQNDLAAATEAAHWLSMIALRGGDLSRAQGVAQEQIARGVEGPYAWMLRVDAAEALSMQPEKQLEALAEFESLLQSLPATHELRPRVLYNAAFTSFQAGEPTKTLAFADQFTGQFASDPLAIDVRFLAAESHLQSAQFEPALAVFEQLLATAPGDHPQRSLWMVRSATAMLNSGKHDDAIARLEGLMAKLASPGEKAEAYFLIGSAHFAAQRPPKAIEAFEKGLAVDPNWSRQDQMLFRLAAALSSAGRRDEGKKTWEQIISRFPQSPFAPQARYRLAQAAAEAKDFSAAVQWYEQILSDANAPGLRPAALYGKGWTLLQANQFAGAIEPLEEAIREFPDHPLRGDCLLARGIAQRKLQREQPARDDLELFLQTQPQGEKLGLGLYELALLDRAAIDPRSATARLERILEEIPTYSANAEVRYELAWAYKDLEDEDRAAKQFGILAEKHPDSPLVAEACYQLGEYHYARQAYDQAAAAYARGAEVVEENRFLEKSLYRLGWAQFQQEQFDRALESFRRLAKSSPEGPLAIDAVMMSGECQFAKKEYEPALATYQQAKELILARDGEKTAFDDPAEQQVRELVFLHGGQSAAQLNRWEEALSWYAALRSRYPASSYLSQVFYETGFASQQLDRFDEAVKFYTEAANSFRDESAARARFMLGEIYFQKKQPVEAITEYKRVMYGYGAEKASPEIQDWQAKSGFEAGRCAELLIQSNEGDRRKQAIELAVRYYEFVTSNHPQHSLASQARERLEALRRM